MTIRHIRPLTFALVALLAMATLVAAMPQESSDGLRTASENSGRDVPADHHANESSKVDGNPPEDPGNESADHRPDDAGNASANASAHAGQGLAKAIEHVPSSVAERLQWMLDQFRAGNTGFGDALAEKFGE